MFAAGTETSDIFITRCHIVLCFWGRDRMTSFFFPNFLLPMLIMTQLHLHCVNSNWTNDSGLVGSKPCHKLNHVGAVCSEKPLWSCSRSM